MGGVRPLVIVKGDPFCHAGFGLRSCLPSVQIDTFILQGPSQALDEDVVEATALTVHRDLGAEPVDCFVQRFNAKVRLQRVGDAPGQNLAGIRLSRSTT